MNKSAATAKARALRNEPSEAEKQLWQFLRNGQRGVRFRRQYPVGPYFADFACRENRLIIELDGGQHSVQRDYDAARTEFLQTQGFKVLRFWNNEIFENLEGVIMAIDNELGHPPPLPPRTRGGDDSRSTRGGAETTLKTPSSGRGNTTIDAPPQAETTIITPPPAGGMGGSDAAPAKSGLDRIRVVGGLPLNGTIRISGAKNAALPLLCASLLTAEPVQFTNMPVSLGDIATLSAVLAELGVKVSTTQDGIAILQAREITATKAPYELVRKMRASVLVLGPLLARCGAAEVSLPGGCAIGTRPVDLHISGLEAMGAQIEIEGGYIKARAPQGLKGTEITFAKVSVGATENLMMAATLAEGVTVLHNAAKEPEINDLGECLIAMGAQIEGLGTSVITITGVEKLRGTVHSVIPDRIETGTWMIAACLTGGQLRLQNARLTHLAALIGPLQEAGLSIEEDGHDIICSRNGRPLAGTDIMTEPYPGFPTDLQAQFMTMLTLCEGAGMVTETIFENRFMHVPELCRMGADIRTQGNSAIIRGVAKLKGAEVMATDLRASVALVLAALVAEGETLINRIYHLDRGYENIVEKLRACGARIDRLPPAP